MIAVMVVAGLVAIGYMIVESSQIESQVDPRMW